MAEPGKTTPRCPPNPDELDRRRLFARICYGLSGVMAAIIAIPPIGFLLGPLLRQEPRVWRDVGKLDHFKEGETVKVTYEDPSPLPWAGVTARSAAWLRRIRGEQFEAFSINCRHLGCPVRWLPDAQLFMCPCHGGVYNKDGTVAAGPPPEPLARYPVRVVGGRVEIQTSPIPLSS